MVQNLSKCHNFVLNHNTVLSIGSDKGADKEVNAICKEFIKNIINKITKTYQTSCNERKETVLV